MARLMGPTATRRAEAAGANPRTSRSTTRKNLVILIMGISPVAHYGVRTCTGSVARPPAAEATVTVAGVTWQT